MISVFLTGASGFVGSYYTSKFKNQFDFSIYRRNQQLEVKSNVVLHLAGNTGEVNRKLIKKDVYETNLILTIKVFEEFLESDAETFIFLSSTKVYGEIHDNIITESSPVDPQSDYAFSKYLAEEYILSKKIPNEKRVYILRSCMIYGEEIRGNFLKLSNYVKSGLPWILGAFENRRTFCNIDNLCFAINELILNKSVPSGIYNISDDDSLSTNDLVKTLALYHGIKVI
jgi:nucleoside-diphosphate-sugar epimerase